MSLPTIGSIESTLRKAWPAFNRRPLSRPDAEALVEKLGLKIRRLDEALWDAFVTPAKVFLVRGLAEPWEVWALLHEAAHHVGHPHGWETYLAHGEEWEEIEAQANTIALLGFFPHPDGPPWPRCWGHTLVGNLMQMRVQLGGGCTDQRLVLRRRH